MRRFLIIVCLFIVSSLSAQTKLINDLQKKHMSLQKQIAATEQLLKTTKTDVRGQLHHLAALNGQIEERKRYIESINGDVNSIDGEVSNLTSQLGVLEKNLNDKKRKYQSSVYYIYKNKTIQDKLMFIFSAKSLTQTYRRLRYVKEYATYQRLQGEEIKERQALVNGKRNQLVQVKQVKVGMVHERENEKAILEQQERQKQTDVANLQKKQRGLQGAVSKKRREAYQLNSRIDRLISMEIEKARRRAEEETRRKKVAAAKVKSANLAKAKAAAERAKEAEIKAIAAEKAAERNKKISSAESTRIKVEVRKATAVRKAAEKEVVAPVETISSISSVDRKLSNTFANNRGRLPMPITGSCIIVSHYGQYAVAGMHNVELDNKGIDIQGHPGACARAIFDGEVSAVFQLNGLVNILVRHGEYISVYCNLSSASVRQGEKVHTRQTLGRVFSDASENGRTVLHFQLREERAKLNPEQWLGR